MIPIQAIDAVVARSAALAVAQKPAAAAFLVSVTESDLTKALLIAPALIVAWYWAGDTAVRRSDVLATIASCALALVGVWCVTTVWLRPRPIAPDAGLAAIGSVFLPHFEHSPDFRWGCFPSDHIAYLATLAFGVGRLELGMGRIAWAIVAVQACARLAVGLHYLSDVAAGVVLAALIHHGVFRIVRIQERAATDRLAAIVSGSRWLQLGLILVVVEMATFFREIRFLDGLIFGGAH
ncbi:MAG: phosphatase PAP2 family protein [Opitutaceae bacterium]|nr:phosphatase PAP2 family protein [Opitutaceae bacterium]